MKNSFPSILRIGIVVLSFAAVYMAGCKPRTRGEESDDEKRRAVSMLMMNEAQRKLVFDNSVGEPLERLKEQMKRYEHMSGEVVYKDNILNKTIQVNTRLEDGRVISQSGVFDNGSPAMIYRYVGNAQFNDSERVFYPNGVLFSRMLNLVDPPRILREMFYQNGLIRNRFDGDTLYSWYENGMIQGKYIFNNEQVGKRTLWHANGKVKEISFWIHDTMNGPYKEWDSTGHLVRDMVFDKGKEKHRH
ncbi:MAG: toxin-antitoxin system YwqK family antitoxin [Bacteroidota bacterium]